MVRAFLLAAVLLPVALAGAQDAGEGGPGEKKGPVLFGDGAGRLWQWDTGEKTFLSAQGLNLVLGGLGEKELWGWSLDRDQARLFTMKLPKKKDKAADAKAPKAKTEPPPVLVYDRGQYPAPDRADRVADRLLLVYGALSGQPRWEVWQAGHKIAARAYDDGRLVYAASLGPLSGWMIAGRTSDGSPWLEVTGETVPAPDGWRGRLTVAAWVEEKKDDAAETPAAPAAEKKKTPPVIRPWAAGWGAPGTATPRALFWGPEGWTQPEPHDSASAGVYPLLGVAADGVLTLAGWQADTVGILHPWFWDGTGEVTPGGDSEGIPQAFSTKGKGGPFLVVRHTSAPWFTLEDGKESQPLEGLDEDDRVVAVAPKDAPEAR